MNHVEAFFGIHGVAMQRDAGAVTRRDSGGFPKELERAVSGHIFSPLILMSAKYVYVIFDQCELIVKSQRKAKIFGKMVDRAASKEAKTNWPLSNAAQSLLE